MPIQLNTAYLMCGALLLLASTFSVAQTPTAAQIEQFKRLPAAQQQALAQQYGVDLNALGQGSNAQPNLGQTASSDARRAMRSMGGAVVEQNAGEATDAIDLSEVKEQKVTGQKLKQFEK